MQAKWGNSQDFGTIEEEPLQQHQAAVSLREEVRRLSLSLQADMQAMQQSASEAKEVEHHYWNHVAH